MTLETFTIVEFPGFSDDPQTLLELCGGLSSVLQSTLSDTTLQINLRKDPLARPLNGDVLSTNNLLIKVMKQTHKRTGQVRYTHTIMGIVSKTVRFRALADFQTIPDPDCSIVRLRKDLGDWNGV